jgi:hypothetical protein
MFLKDHTTYYGRVSLTGDSCLQKHKLIPSLIYPGEADMREDDLVKQPVQPFRNALRTNPIIFPIHTAERYWMFV